MISKGKNVPIKLNQCPQEQVGIAFGKGGTSHTGGFFRHRLQGVRV